MRRGLLFIMIIGLLVGALGPWAALADESSPLAIEGQTVASGDVAPPLSPYGLYVQATSWPGPSHRYVLTLANFTPWTMASVRVLDRFFPNGAQQVEINHEWLHGVLKPSQAVSFVIELPSTASGGCHQLEIGMANGLFSILMDCSGLGKTTIWNVPLNERASTFFREVAQATPDAPTVEPIMRGEATGQSKIGIHVTSNNSPTIMDYVRSTQPAVVVALGGLGWLTEVKQASPQTITLGRLLEGNQSIADDPVDRAREYVAKHIGEFAANPGVDYWLGWNEPVIDDVGQMEWFAAFEAERVRAMAELGYKVAVGNFSAGTPEADEFEAFLPAIEVAKQHGAILALHEYSAPTMRDGVGAGVPGVELHPEHGALTLRYRCWYDTLLQPRDLVLPLVITEAGLDAGVLPYAVEGGLGWRDVIAMTELGASPTELKREYLRQLSWYDDELRRDPYVMGFAVFNVGDSGGTWQSFDVTDILPQIGDLSLSKMD
jgi:hypothetical protein